MNKIFKVVWNRTIQSFVVTSELAKGRVKSSAEQNSTDVSAESGKNGIATVFRLTVISAALFGASNAYAATAQVGRIEVDNTTSATAISGATATGVGALGVGLTAQANQGNAIAIGNSAKAQTANTIAIGKDAVANSPASGNAASSAIALGADANATGLGTIAIGRASEVLSQNSMNVNVTHNNIAIGNTARVGDSSSSKITQSIAIGSGNRVDPQGRPEGAWAKGDQSIAVGGNVLANGNSSVAIGGDDLDAVGGTRYSGNATDKFIKYNAQGAKTGEYTLSGKSLRDIYKEMTGDTMNYGSYGNTIAGQGSVALGVQSNSSADLSLAIGTKSQATAFGGVALGTGAKATLLNSVALGTASKTDKEGKAYVQREIMGVTYTWAGGQTTDAGDVVSVGSKGYERQIINVSPGDISATSTDAINGSQLYGVLSAIERIRYFSVKSTDGSTDGTKNWNNDGAKGANSIAIGPSASTTSAATNGVAIGNQANVTGVNAVALGNGTTASVQDSVALGNGAVGAANNFDATAKNASFKNDSGAATNVSYAASSSSTTGAVSVGSAGNERQIQNVAAGRISATSTDAVNGSQLYTVMNNVGHNIQQNGTDKSRINNNGTVNYADGNLTTVAVTDGENASKVQINVTQGSLSVDNNGTVSAPTAGVATAGDVANAINNAKTTTKVEAGSNTHVNKTTLGKETTYTVSADKATVQVSNALNLTSNTTTAADGAVTTNYSIDLAQSTKDNIQKGVDAKTTVDTKGLTFNGDSGSTNVEKLGSTVTVAGDGNITTEAQGDKVSVKLSKDLVVNSVKAGDTTVNTDGVKVGDVNLTKDGLDNGGNKITNVAAGTDDTDAVNVAQLNKAAAAAKTEVVQGDNIVVTQDVGANGQTIYKVATDKNLKVDSVTAGDTVMNNDGVKVGDDVALNKDGLKAGDVNLTKAGLNNGGNKITNVAAGTEDTDAVNVSQLKQAAAASKTEVVQGKNIVVTEKTGYKGQTVYEVATDKDLDVDSVKAGDTTVNNDGVKVGDNVALNKDGLKAGDVNLTKDGLDNAGNKVTNVADGDINANSKDAVNGSQLYATNQNVANNAATIAKGINFGGTTGSNNYALGDTINVKGDSNIISETVAGGAQLKLADEISVKTVNADTFKAGDTVMNNDGVKVGDKVALNKDGLTAGNTVVNNDGVTIAAPTENNPNNQVKLSPVGLNNGGQRITNVAPGKDGTDAANVNQLIGLGNELQNNINQVGKKAYAGVAGAIAQGSIPQVTRPGATGIGVGSGYYGGQSAMAIGVSAMSDGGNWIVKGNFSANTDGHVGVGAGALYQW